MEATGIICEYNPFHNGHLYHLNKVKELYPNDVIVLIMSGYFMQRGETSVIGKWDRTKIALTYGADLVIELPFPFATQSADVFARGSIQLLKSLQVSKLVFGSESSDISFLEKIVDIQLNEPSFQARVKEFMKQGLNYPTAMSKALTFFSILSVNSPNDLLGISYIKSIQEIKANIKAITIQRTNDHHSLNTEKSTASGSAIRKSLKNGDPIEHMVPPITIEHISSPTFIEDYFPFLKYKIITEIHMLNSYQTVDEGLNARICSAIMNSESLEDLIQKVKTKRYTYNKLSRMFTHILCNFTKEEANSFQNIEYIRILGFSDIGKKYLNNIKKNLSIPLVTRFGDTKSKMLDLEYRVSRVYASVLPKEKQNKIIKTEYQCIPIQISSKEKKVNNH